MRAALSDVNSPDRRTAVTACSNTDSCEQSMQLSGEEFDQIEGMVNNDATKQYRVHFAPDNGYALGAKVYVDDGGVVSTVRAAPGKKRRRKRADTGEEEEVGDDEELASDELRPAQKAIEDIEYYLDAPKATHQVTLMHCDGYGEYEIHVNGKRVPVEPITSEDPEWVEFYEQYGQPEFPTRTSYSVMTQYIPYPSLPKQRIEVTDSGADYVVLHVPAMVSNLPAADAAVSEHKYHVYWTTQSDVQPLTVCDLMRSQALPLAVTKSVPAAPYDANAAVEVRVENLPSSANVRMFVIAENEGRIKLKMRGGFLFNSIFFYLKKGGALALYGTWGDASASESVTVSTSASGSLIGITVALVLLALGAVALAVLYAARHFGKYSGRLPFVAKDRGVYMA